MNFLNCHVSDKSIELVNQVLQSRKLSEGEMVKRFEEQLSKKLGLRNPVVVNSGTSALHLGLVLAGVEVGDEVILPAQTFIATGMAVLMCGATPVFADIDPLTGCVCPESVEGLVRGHKTNGMVKAIMPVHWGGFVPHSPDLEIPHVEDAAHSLGASYRGYPIGMGSEDDASEFVAFSLQATKMLTSGDGGILCCRNEDDYEEAKKRRWFGIPREAKPDHLGERVYDVEEVGFKYNLNEVAAAIGLGNLEDFPQRWFRRQEIARCYREGLEGVKGIRLMRVEPDRTHAYYFFSLLADRRDDLAKKLNGPFGTGGCTSVVCRRIDRFKVFGGIREELKGQREYDEHHLALPTHEEVTDEQVESIIRTIQEGW